MPLNPRTAGRAVRGSTTTQSHVKKCKNESIIASPPRCPLHPPAFSIQCIIAPPLAPNPHRLYREPLLFARVSHQKRTLTRWPPPPRSSCHPHTACAKGVLSPLETLAQSLSTIAPTATPAATIPLVCALAGNATWLAYALATSAIFLVALCIARFARYSASPGSLYIYATSTLSPWLAATAAWSLLLALRGHRQQRDRRIFSLRQSADTGHDRPLVFRRTAGAALRPEFPCSSPGGRRGKFPPASCCGSKPSPWPPS